MLDPTLNRIPTHVKGIHLIAICGTAMGALASMLREMGYEVTGSDQQVYPPMSEFLQSKGIKIGEGFHGEHLDYSPDLVIVGNAISWGNPEVDRLHNIGLSYCSMPQAINHFVAADKDTCSGCGDCIDRCQMEALSLVDDVISVNEEMCVGCANCVPVCPTESLSMVRRADDVPPESKDTLHRLGMG